jgi:cytochrome oxidase assembly protein ShyY1
MFLLSKWLIESILEYGIVWKILDIGMICLIIYIIYRIITNKNVERFGN